MEFFNMVLWKGVQVLFILVALKSMIFGSNYNPILHIKYGNTYFHWYEENGNPHYPVDAARKKVE